MNEHVVNWAITAKTLAELWTPHPGQSKIIKALFIDWIKDLFIEAGRNAGKTELLSYCFWRYAQSFPGTENYYFAPEQKQAKEILWSSNRIQNFGPREWLLGGTQGINHSEMRLKFRNGSFIKIDGSDNIDSYRGVKPSGLVAYDEFKDFRPEFHETFDPNRAAFNIPLIIIGTPPQEDGHFQAVADSFKNDPKKFYYHAPSSENPYLSREWLESKRTELYNKGEGYIWEREYMALRVKGSHNRVFPMLSDKIKIDPSQVKEIIHRDGRKLEYILWTDPGVVTVFGVLFGIFNRFSKELYIVDEIYEKDKSNNAVSIIGKRILEKRDAIRQTEWRQGYDEAETWFQREMLDQFEESFEPSHKHLNDKEDGISLIKDLMLKHKLFISTQCAQLFWELDNYYLDKHGKLQKKNDHLIDCLRYMLGALHYSLTEERFDPIKEYGPRKLKQGGSVWDLNQL